MYIYIYMLYLTNVNKYSLNRNDMYAVIPATHAFVGSA